ncbi:MAG: DUF3857 domain-containing protein [Thermoanaerobaculia bacterium]
MLRRLILILALAPAALFARSYGEFDVASAPKWIDRVPGAYGISVPQGLARYGVYDILSDHQVRIGRQGETAQYFRTVRKILTQSGVQNASELAIDFDPSFQRLTIHEISIIRGANQKSVLDPSAVRVIEKEADADNAIYDGRLSALVFLKDLRAGDVIDWSWSIDGANPILHGRYADELDLRSEIPSHLIRHRLIWDGARPLQTNGQAPVQTGNMYTWEARDVDAVNLEDALPSWYEPWNVVEVSDFASWNEVARWATATFSVDEDSYAAVKSLAAKIRRDDAADPITAATRFVQDDIRYLGLEIGRNSHEPRQPKEILEQRWGDCKEKALLLSLLLRELGLQADPALVNTKAKQRLDTSLPSPFAFDHVVVRVLWKGKTYWIDPTIADQGGTLETVETPNDRRALVVSNDSTALANVDTARRGRTLIDETYAAQSRSSATTLVVRSTYSGGDADAMRTELASMAPDEISRDRINRYAADHPTIASTAAPHIEDDRVRNVIVILERYSIRDLWRRGAWTYTPNAIESSFQKPKTVIRSMPLSFDYPLDIVQRATFRFPAGALIDSTEALSRKTAAFLYRFRPTEREQSVTLEYSLRALRDSIPAADVRKHLTAINDIEVDMPCTVRPSFGTAEMRLIDARPPPFPLWMWGVAVALAIGGLGLLRYWKLSVISARWLRHRVMTVRD